MTEADLVPVEPAPWASYQRRRAEGEIPFQRCDGCARSVFPPRVLCPHCGSIQLRWQESAGLGTVYSQTFVSGRDGGYHVLLVDLEEGFRVMASADDDAADYPLGARVRGRVATDSENADQEPRLVFSREAS
ncbi:Zn-ribbon domain-containing OB-fold protein [Microbacterium sp. zg.Y909]|uniref:Zn-ribbon domain-containing OB-fold protein n=1 Tax=Microbacterium sp. zg.Y909 TaxID=2969413 RepID=UPI00214C5222|nr:zinc ribbon domain-containing protein [Microbacterium sp. zg.Y909]MCR2824107.1 zinc ribbon domain-containing protein [Microbacterium sp. zg.Y909]